MLLHSCRQLQALEKGLRIPQNCNNSTIYEEQVRSYFSQMLCQKELFYQLCRNCPFVQGQHVLSIKKDQLELPQEQLI